ncbi:hypothetical protein CVT26_002391 [Gymnopilus dilepis]|uniref:Blue (type 1) copper domain-containing protein n=1 Tax=Gymnopilus dilepis TaxID=231916 RepID=A0A409YN63_9AGAR|nr:hypothetical protein CVT26_002391 [Gymnopilus dilepis]
MKASLMRYPSRSLPLPLVLTLFQCLPLPFSVVSQVGAQTTHMVNVGLQGSFFDPPTLAAGLGDTVTFVFEGLVHTVTQSTAQNPCLALPGGFSSGPVGKPTNDSSIPAPVWSLKITNVSAPIWFFCEVTEPTSHCASGMVGVINPPSQAAYESFRSAAFAVTGTPVPAFTVALSGVGAVATAAPSTPPAPSSSPSASSSSLPPATSSSSTPSPTSPPTSSATKSHLGAIIGGAVGGGALLVILAALFLWFYHAKRMRNSFPGSPVSDDSRFFRYNPKPVPEPKKLRPSQAFVAAKQLEATGAVSEASASREGLGNSNGNGGKNESVGVSIPRTLSPNRSPYAPPGVQPTMTTNTSVTNTPAQPNQLPRLALGIDRQSSFATNASSNSTSNITNINSTTTTNARMSEVPISPATINMHALANEVATLLRQPSANTLSTTTGAEPVPPLPQGPRPRPSNKHLEARVTVSSVDGPGHGLGGGGAESPHPPAYRPSEHGG